MLTILILPILLRQPLVASSFLRLEMPIQDRQACFHSGWRNWAHKAVARLYSKRAVLVVCKVFGVGALIDKKLSRESFVGFGAFAT